MIARARLHQLVDTLPEREVENLERQLTDQHPAVVSGHSAERSQELPRTAPLASHSQESEWAERSWATEIGWVLVGATVLLVVAVVGAALIAAVSGWSTGTPTDLTTGLRTITQNPEPYIGTALAGGLFTLVGRDLSIRRR